MPLTLTIPAPSMRFVLVHYHIFKNAGSTIESILEREFPHEFATLHGPCDNSTLDAADLASFLQCHPRIPAISSHHLHYPKPVLRDVIVFDWCFLRHPIDRLRSLYTYMRMIDTTDPLGRLARQMNPQDFITSLIEKFPNIVSNVQVTQLANAAAFTRPAGPRDLERAIQVLYEMAIPGLVELFDESLVAAEHFLQPAFPGIQLEYTPKNVSVRRDRSVSQRAWEWSEYWGANAYQELLKLNQLDLELYDRAAHEIKRRLALVPDSGEKMRQFKVRCSRLSEAQAKVG